MGCYERNELVYIVYKFGEIWLSNSGIYKVHFVQQASISTGISVTAFARWLGH